MDVYPEYVDYYAVLAYLENEIKLQALSSEDVDGILEREFGITLKTPDDVKKYVFSDLKERVRTQPEGDSIVFYKRVSDLEEYRTSRALSRLFG